MSLETATELHIRARAIERLIEAGFGEAAVVDAVVTGDLRRLIEKPEPHVCPPCPRTHFWETSWTVIPASGK